MTYMDVAYSLRSDAQELEDEADRLEVEATQLRKRSKAMRAEAKQIIKDGSATKVGDLVVVNKPAGFATCIGDRIYPYIGKIVKEVNPGKWGVVRLADMQRYVEAPAHSSRDRRFSIPGRDRYIHMEFKAWCQKGVQL